MIGTAIAHYKVTAKIGEGGMGEVYRATDSRLNRDVALKVIPQAFAADAQRMARFQREAQVLASLNHPNIAGIYGLEETGAALQPPAAGSGQASSAPSQRALVMELVEGPTLAARIADGAVPPDEALAIARQIAEALEYAHERGIIHRDLKPANIKLTSTAQVKILDFGLAKALADDVMSGGVSTSPTMSIAATKAGIILGTASYMSPEQAKGKQVDRRADIWSFGVVLWEMLTGRPMYAGETISETLAHVIMKDPDLGALPEGVPRRIRLLLARCFEKDPRKRLRDIGEARIVIEDVIANPRADSAVGIAPTAAVLPGKRNLLPWAIAALLMVTTMALLVTLVRQWRSERPALQASIAPPEGAAFWLLGTQPGPPAVSPDGTMVTYALLVNNRATLYLRRLDSAEAQPLGGTDGAIYPFWSPDSRWIGFFAGGKLKKIEVSGGPPVVLCDAPNGKGGTWNRDGVIVFAPAHDTPLHRVPAAGGPSTAITKISEERRENSHRLPQFLPDGKHFIYLARATSGEHGIRAGSLDGGEEKALMGNWSAPQYASGYMLFTRDGALLAQAFDAGTLEFRGDPTPLANNVMTLSSGAGRAVFSASENGVLVYAVGRGPGEDTFELEWFDRTGKKLGTLGDKAHYRGLALSPDGQKAAVTMLDPDRGLSDIWVYDVKRNLRTRLTFEPGNVSDPIWSPDGNSIVYASRRKGNEDLYMKSLTGLGPEELLYESPATETPSSWSSDGKYIAFNVFEKNLSISVLPMTGDHKPFPVIKNQFFAGDPQFSPDGKWLSYTSEESGRDEIYVVPFPKVTRKFQISQNGLWARWSRNGREIIYQTVEGRMMVVDISFRGEVLEAGIPKALFDGPPATDQLQIVPMPDGQKFLAIASGNQQPTRPMHLVVNWPALLKKK